MNKKIKRKWVAALRGGNWQQCFGRARGQGNQGCALEVLAEVVGVHLEVDQVDLEHNLLGLDEQQYDSIYLFNDDDRKSFEEIANLTEQSSDLPYHEPRERTPEGGDYAEKTKRMLAQIEEEDRLMELMGKHSRAYEGGRNAVLVERNRYQRKWRMRQKERVAKEQNNGSSDL